MATRLFEQGCSLTGNAREDNALRLGSGPAQKHREASMPGEIPTLRDRTDKRGPEDVERLGGNDQCVARGRLLPALGGTQIDVINVSAIHLREPRGPQPGRPARRDLQRLARRSDRIPPSVGQGCSVPCAGGHGRLACLPGSGPVLPLSPRAPPPAHGRGITSLLSLFRVNDIPRGWVAVLAQRWSSKGGKLRPWRITSSWRAEQQSRWRGWSVGTLISGCP